MVNSMTQIKTSPQLAILLFTLVLPNAVVAEESVNNKHKNNGTSNADFSGHIDGDISFAVNSQTNVAASSQQKFTNDIRTFKQMEERRRQMQEAQLEAYKRHLQERRNSPANNKAHNHTLPEDVQARRKEYIKLMNERRALMKKMMDEHRQAVEERRRVMLLKMHQTSNTPARYYS